MNRAQVRPQRLVILGSTGSVGTSTLDVVARHPERFEVVGLSAYQRVDVLLQQCGLAAQCASVLSLW